LICNGGGGKILKRNSSSIVVVAEVNSCKHLIDELRRELKEFNDERSCSSRTMVNARFSSTI
jgi:hypothetical protein